MQLFMQLQVKSSCALKLLVCLSFRGFTRGGAVEELKQEKDNVINIFSVASGHLYERFLRWVSESWPPLTCTNNLIYFSAVVLTALSPPIFSFPLRIMMLSVLKNTKTPVKFWFLKNYLSPTFKVRFNLHFIHRCGDFVWWLQLFLCPSVMWASNKSFENQGESCHRNEIFFFTLSAGLFFNLWKLQIRNQSVFFIHSIAAPKDFSILLAAVCH